MRRPLVSRSILLVGLAVCAVSCQLACDRVQPGPSTPTSSFLSPKDLGADSPPPKSALLQLAGGEPLKVDVEATRDGQNLQIDLVSHGEAIETETYSITPTSFNLVEAAGESYEPVLPLLKFPLTVGNQWSWKGQIVLSSADIPAEATVTTATEPLGLEGYPLEAVQISVTLEIGDPLARAAKRVLNFWVAPGYGVIKREFGLASSRIPAPKPTEATPRKGAK